MALSKTRDLTRGRAGAYLLVGRVVEEEVGCDDRLGGFVEERDVAVRVARKVAEATVSDIA